MPKASTPELKKFMDKRIFIQLNGSRKVVGTLRGYDVSLLDAGNERVDEAGVFEYRA